MAAATTSHFSSDLALRVYRPSFLGTDRVVGETVEISTGLAAPVELPADGDWVVGPQSPDVSDGFLDQLIERAGDLRGLSLSGCRDLTPAALARLARLSGLERLDLFHTRAGDEVVAAIAPLAGLRELNLGGTAVTDEVAGHLAGMRRLERLHLGWTAVGDAAVRRLAGLPALRVLQLGSTRITDRAADDLARLPALEVLGLERTAITDGAIARLVPLAGRLEGLSLAYTAVTDRSVEVLTAFTRLRSLVLRATHVSRERDGELRRALPQLAGDGVEGLRGGLVR